MDRVAELWKGDENKRGKNRVVPLKPVSLQVLTYLEEEKIHKELLEEICFL